MLGWDEKVEGLRGKKKKKEKKKFSVFFFWRVK